MCSPPLIETYREGAVCPSYAFLYSSVLSLLQKPVNVKVRARRAKLRDPHRANELHARLQLTKSSGKKTSLEVAFEAV